MGDGSNDGKTPKGSGGPGVKWLNRKLQRKLGNNYQTQMSLLQMQGCLFRNKDMDLPYYIQLKKIQDKLLPTWPKKKDFRFAMFLFPSNAS